MNVKLLTEHHLEFLSLKGGCTCSSESTLVKMPHCWQSHVTAHILNVKVLLQPFSLCHAMHILHLSLYEILMIHLPKRLSDNERVTLGQI